MFGPLLVICTTLNLFVGVVVIMIDFIVTVFPEKTEATMEKVGLMLKFSHARQVSKPTTVAPIGPLSGKGRAIIELPPLFDATLKLSRGVPSTEIMQVSARQPTTTSSGHSPTTLFTPLAPGDKTIFDHFLPLHTKSEKFR